jgi:hypothetical protein
MKKNIWFTMLVGLILFGTGISQAQTWIGSRVNAAEWDAGPAVKDYSNGKYNCRIQIDISNIADLSIKASYFYYFSTDSASQVATANAFYETFKQSMLSSNGLPVYILVDSNTKNIISVSLGAKPQSGEQPPPPSGVSSSIRLKNIEPNTREFRTADILGRSERIPGKQARFPLYALKK